VGAVCGGATPVTFSNGAVSSGLTYTFSGLASGADDLSFSNTGSPGVFTYTPTPAANGCDVNVSTLRVNPKGVFASGEAGAPFPSFTLRFRVCIR